MQSHRYPNSKSPQSPFQIWNDFRAAEEGRAVEPFLPPSLMLSPLPAPAPTSLPRRAEKRSSQSLKRRKWIKKGVENLREKQYNILPFGSQVQNPEAIWLIFSPPCKPLVFLSPWALAHSPLGLRILLSLVDPQRRRISPTFLYCPSGEGESRGLRGGRADPGDCQTHNTALCTTARMLAPSF